MDNDTPFPFTPAPSRRARHDGWTPLRQVQFIEALAVMANVEAACRAVGLSPSSAYALRKKPGAESFAAAWDDALFAGRQRAFEIAYERATKGYQVPRFYKGQFVGMSHRFDHRLALRALGPAPKPEQANAAMKAWYKLTNENDVG